MSLRIHIVTFDIPYPANYGGVIDVFYRIQSLKAAGVAVILHCFQYGGREASPELESLCEKVYYYARKKSPQAFHLPYIVSSRIDRELLKNLQKTEDPILFEALHCCYFLSHPNLKHRQKMVRMHNIEHEYYDLLAQSEKSFLKRIYFKLEARLLQHYEDILNNAQLIFAISAKDERNLKQRFPGKVSLLPAFHGNKVFHSKTGKSNFCFYHGKLSVGENHAAAMFLVNEVFSKLNTPLIIAGNGALPELKKAAQQYPHISIEENYTPQEIINKIREAHINVLPTFQPTGIKLKLINTLYNGRHILANTAMVAETGLEQACTIANTPAQFIAAVEELMKREFKAEDLEKRINTMGQGWDDASNALRLIQELS